MVLAANNSAVISAACHSVPSKEPEQEPDNSQSSLLRDFSDNYASLSPEERGLLKMSTQRLGWGCINAQDRDGTVDNPGHLAFAPVHQTPTRPIDGHWHQQSQRKLELINIEIGRKGEREKGSHIINHPSLYFPPLSACG
jgi:hypothetical protein